jgi:hypothetical protein
LEGPNFKAEFRFMLLAGLPIPVRLGKFSFSSRKPTMGYTLIEHEDGDGGKGAFRLCDARQFLF